MKKVALGSFFVAVALCAGVTAQTDGGAAFSLQQQKIDALKQQAGAYFDTLEQACMDRFAVNDCLKDVKRRRLARMAEIKREELVLHNAQRKQRGIEQNARIEQKAIDRLALEEENAAASSPEKTEAKRLEQTEKQRAHAAQASGSQPQRPGAAASSGLTSAEENENRAAYLQKLQDAEKKRQERAKRLSEKGSATPLPP
jgi:colicin import membrane protein